MEVNSFPPEGILPPAGGSSPELPTSDVVSGAGDISQVPVDELADGAAAGGDVTIGGDTAPDITAPDHRVPAGGMAEGFAEVDAPAELPVQAEALGRTAVSTVVNELGESQEHVRSVAADEPPRRRYLDVPIDGAARSPEPPAPAEVVEAMDQAGLADYFGSPDAAKEALRGTSTDEYHELVNRANGAIRGVTADQQGYAPEEYLTEALNESTGKVELLSPTGADRRMLMGEGFEAAQQLDDLERAGTLLNVVTANTHPWEDGSGRMARGQQELLHRGYTGSGADKEYYARLLTNHDGRYIVNTSDVAGFRARFNQAVTRGIVEAVGQGQFVPDGGIVPFDRGRLGVGTLPPGDVRRDLIDMAEEPHFGTTVLTAVAVQSGRDLYDYVLQHPQTGKQYFDATRLIEDIGDNESGLVWDAYGLIKRQFVRSLVDCLGPRGDESLYGPPGLVVARHRSTQYQGRWQ